MSIYKKNSSGLTDAYWQMTFSFMLLEERCDLLLSLPLSSFLLPSGSLWPALNQQPDTVLFLLYILLFLFFFVAIFQVGRCRICVWSQTFWHWATTVTSEFLNIVCHWNISKSWGQTWNNPAWCFGTVFLTQSVMRIFFAACQHSLQ